MNPFISILLFLSFLLQPAISTIELTKLRLSNGHITGHPFQASRNLDTYFIDFSYINETSYILADFGTPFYENNNGTNQNDTLMTVTISSNETVFFGNFSEGNDFFPCDPSYCTQDNSSAIIPYQAPWISGNTTQITLNTTISIAFGAWQLATPALYMTHAPSELDYSGGIYGSIGLGTANGSQQNFYGQNPLFSIFYNFTSNTGDLIFGYNSTYANTSKPSMTLTSDPNWQMQLASISVGNLTVYTVNETHPITMLFDLMTNVVNLPSHIVTNITNGMNSLGMNCGGGSCMAQNLTGLPSIIFTLADNTQLTLGPEVYMMQESDGTDDSSDITDTTDTSDLTDQSDSSDSSNSTNSTGSAASPPSTFYVSIPFITEDETEYFEKNIIFGTQILSYFYTVFQQVNGNNTITLYSIPDNVTVEDQVSPPIIPDDGSDGIPDNSSSDPDVSSPSDTTTHIIYIIVAACVALVIVLAGALILGIKRGWFKKKTVSEDTTNSFELNRSQVSEASRVALTL